MPCPGPGDKIGHMKRWWPGDKNAREALPRPCDWGALESASPLSEAEIEEKARFFLGQMSLEEKVAQMSGSLPKLRSMPALILAYNTRPFPAGENRRLVIPPILFTDGPRGVALNSSTCFPVSMARGASWDTHLEERIGDAMGVEARSQGSNLLGSICINLLRHPAWGRAQETYGEDPHHLGEMGAALVRGIQRHAMACVKHYAANSIENTRLKVDVRMDERTLQEVYLPHFKRCVDEGAACIMSAYNRVNGSYCSHNPRLLRDILKGDWGFKGFVVSDFIFAVHHPKAAGAGLDLEMPFTDQFGRKLVRLVRKGEVAEEVIDEAVLRLLRQKVRFAQIGEPDRYRPEAVASVEHVALARESASKSIVLLKNDNPQGGDRPLLPLDAASVKKISVIGRLASRPNCGDTGSSKVRPPYVITILDGIRGAADSGCQVITYGGRSVNKAARLVRGVDAVVIVAGYTRKDEGERISFRGGDRRSLTLSKHEEKLIVAIARENPRTVVVLIGGSAIVTERWRKDVPAAIMAWYPGMEGGNALADILFGRVNPSGKLPCSFPASGEQLPPFDNRSKQVRYGYLHGYRLMDEAGSAPAFPFGFGLSYTTYRYSDLRLGAADLPSNGVLEASVDVANTGGLAGEEVVQMYVGRPLAEAPVKELKGFARVRLQPGETRRVSFSVDVPSLAGYDDQKGAWLVAPGDYTVFVGPSSRASDLLTAGFHVVGTEASV